MSSGVILRFLGFFGTVSLILCGANYLLMKRRLGLSKRGNLYLLLFYTIAALMILSGPALYRGLQPRIDSLPSSLFQWLQYFLMGLMGTNLFTLVIIEFMDLVRLPFKPERRMLLSQGVFRGVMGASTFSVFGGLLVAKAGPSINPIEIKLKTLPKSFDGLRITQISDVHIGPLLHGDFLKKVVEQVNSTNPDLIFITGDLVDGSVEQIHEHMEPLRNLKARDGVYFCTGNHEYYAGVDEWIPHLESMGIHVFKNSNRLLRRGNEKLLIGGVYDFKAGQYSADHACDPSAAAKTSEDVSCKILISHNPMSIDAAADAGFHLQISGHTHAGQFYPFAFIVKVVLKHVEGLYQINENTQLFINRGTGYWGPPHRLGKRSEISQITLRSGLLA